ARWVLRWPFLWLSILPCSAPAPPTACACWQPARKRPATTRGPAARASRASRCDRFPPQQRSLEMGVDLPLIWAVIILFGVMMYVVMDGFDLGIGILFPFFQDTADRDVMMNTVAPVWDGNETWLVLGGAGLLAAFPLAYSVVLSALHLPLTLMLTGLIFRGVAFEFRFKARAGRLRLWDKAFAGGSLTATFFQGVTLGAFLNGLPVVDGRYAGSSTSWVAPFPIFTGLGLIVAYALLGATWLVMKTEGPLQQRLRAIARRLTVALLAVIVAISLW